MKCDKVIMTGDIDKMYRDNVKLCLDDEKYSPAFSR